MTRELSDAEARRLVLAVVHGCAPGGADRELVDAVVEWAEKVRTDMAILNTLLAGKILVTGVDPNDAENFTFRAVTEAEREKYDEAIAASDAMPED